LAMGVGLVAVGAVGAGGGWPAAVTTPLLFCAGAGNAWAFSPLANRLTSVVDVALAADVSGLIITASLVGQVLGVAAFVDVYFAALPRLGRRARAHDRRPRGGPDPPHCLREQRFTARPDSRAPGLTVFGRPASRPDVGDLAVAAREVHAHRDHPEPPQRRETDGDERDRDRAQEHERDAQGTKLRVGHEL